MTIFVPVKEMKSYSVLLFSLLLVSLSVTSCYESDTCSENNVTGINVSVTSVDTLNSSEGSWAFTPIDDTTQLVSSDDVSYSTGIPLDMSQDSIELYFMLRDNDTLDYYIADKVVFRYTQTDMVALSLNCGFAPEFQISSIGYTANLLDSVFFLEDVVSTDLELTNVSFYY